MRRSSTKFHHVPELPKKFFLQILEARSLVTLTGTRMIGQFAGVLLFSVKIWFQVEARPSGTLDGRGDPLQSIMWR